MKRIIAGIFRHLISSGGSAIALKAFVAGDKVSAAISAVVAVSGVVLSVIHKLEEDIVKLQSFAGTLRSTNEPRKESGPTIPIVGTALVLLLAVTGCGSIRGPVPANRIVIHAPSGDYKVETPKNVAIDKFTASVNSNGLFSVHFDKWTSTNDPQVIDKSFAGQAMVAKEFFDGFSNLADKLMQGAVKGATHASVRPPLKLPEDGDTQVVSR